MYSTPDLHGETLIPSGVVLGGGTFGRYFSHEGEEGIMALTRKERRELASSPSAG